MKLKKLIKNEPKKNNFPFLTASDFTENINENVTNQITPSSKI